MNVSLEWLKRICVECRKKHYLDLKRLYWGCEL